MRKEYVRPYLAVESFQMDAGLAGSCAVKLSHDVNGCTLNDEQGLVYNMIYYGPACQANGGIDMQQENPDICYHALIRSGPFQES